jgi:hypothetical protein
MKATKKTTWIVMKGDEEISRHTSKKMAEVVASELGGYVIRYQTW